MAIGFDYFRVGRQMSPPTTKVPGCRLNLGANPGAPGPSPLGTGECSPSVAVGAPSSPRRSFCVKRGIRLLLTAAALCATLPALAQYPGQVAKTGKETPELRAIAVLEWTGDAGKPKTSRLVPVAVLDGGKLEDGGIYMARPEPLALTGEVEYELEQDGKPVGLYDLKNAGQEQGSWVGYGAWKAMPAPKPRPSAKDLAKIHIDDDVQSDEPVLHRKHHAADAPSAGTGSGSGSSDPAPATDPDRPTLHKKPSSDSGSSQPSSGQSGGGSNSASTDSAAPPDPDRPTLHKKDSDSGSSGGTAQSDDPDRPVLKKSRKKPEDTGHVDSLPDVTDPDRPRLRRGKSDSNGLTVNPSLMGLPTDLQQAVAVSDSKTRPDHSWNYSWTNPDDEDKMKSALEDIARGALGLNPPPPPPTPKKTSTRRNAKSAAAPEPPPPAPLLGEEFRVFELAYNSGATMVLTAHTDGPPAQQRFVTLVAQPDFYGNALVLLKNVTDGAHLDERPRLRLVDAVDAMADNRGELLFELRGATQRQFALYRVTRGQAEKLFVSGGGDFGVEASN